ncbi:MAG: di-heme oxidoredictase family protein [Acidobacteriota bacterium]
MKRSLLLGGAISLLLFSQAFSQSGATSSGLLPGSPLSGITPSEHELFRIGLDDFTGVETAADGLGPAFNGTSCAVCHSVPAIGGVSSITEVRAGHRDADGVFHALNGGTLYHLFSVPPHTCQVQIPVEANVIARRAPIPLFGAGLIEAIPDESILALEDPEDSNNDGIRGRAGRVIDVATGRDRIGRFGWKAQHATLLAFSGDAYRNEMGITNDLFRDEEALGFTKEQLRLCSVSRGLEDVRDKRTGLRSIDKFTNFMRLLAPLDRGPIDDAVRSGEALFRAVGCASCHTPVFMTGFNSNPIFDRKPVPLYSDLLLHDIATGDGIEQASAKAGEIRTPALWGLRLRRPLLHDGSAATSSDAISRHAGDATGVVERYKGLADAEREQLLAFLNSL